MLRDTVRPCALIALVEQVLIRHLSTRATDAAEAVNDDVVRFDETVFERGRDAENNARGITTGARHELGLPNFIPMDLGQAVHRLLQQLRRGMWAVVEL